MRKRLRCRRRPVAVRRRRLIARDFDSEDPFEEREVEIDGPGIDDEKTQDK